MTVATLPLVPVALPAERVEQRVLIIDDNSEIHQDFRKILGVDGGGLDGPSDTEVALFGDDSSAHVERVRFRVDSAFQGQEGLALIKKAIAENDPYVLAFIDVRMPPGWDG